MKFIDFCAGIGGGRLGLEKLGMKCVGFSEIDEKAENIYRRFFGNDEVNYGDLMKINSNSLPNFDLLIAGFPCQSFSIVGLRKGLRDERGKIIYGLLKIMKAKRTKCFILENVKGLLNHEKGRTFKTILSLLDSEGYRVIAKTLDSSHYGLPHKRERVYFIGIRKDLIEDLDGFCNFFLQNPKKSAMECIRKYLIDAENLAFTNGNRESYKTFLKYLKNKYNKGQFSTNSLLKEELLIIDTRQSDLRLYKDKIPTLRTGRHGILYIKDKKFRRLSGYESLLLQGFPSKLAIKVKGKVSESRLLSLTGNAMSVNVIEVLGKNLLEFLSHNINSNIMTKLSNKSIRLTKQLSLQ